MKVITKAVYQMTDTIGEYELIEEQSYEHDGAAAEAKGGSGGGTTVQKQEPWDAAKPYYERTYRAGEAAMQNPAEFYQGSTLAPLNSNITNSQDWMLNYGNQADQLLKSGTNLAGDVIRGDYLDPNYGAGSTNMTNTMSGKFLNPNSNPYLRQNVNQAVGDVISQFNETALPNIRGESMMAGQFGGSRQGIAEGKAYDSAMKNAMRTANEMYGANYNTERDRQMQATGQFSSDYQQGIGNMLNTLGGLGNLTQAAMLPGQIQGNVGAEQYDYAQAGVDEDVARWDYEQAQAWNNIQNMAALLNGGSFANTSSTTPRQSNTGQYVGAGLTAAGLLA